MDSRYGSPTVFTIEHPFVWLAKYRYPVLKGEVGERVWERVRQTCEAFENRIGKGVVSKDHVPILASAPPELAPSEIMRRIKCLPGRARCGSWRTASSAPTWRSLWWTTTGSARTR